MKILLPIHTGHIVIDTDDLYYLRSDGKVCQAVKVDGEVHCMLTLQEVKGELPEDFVFVHKSYIVNLSHITRVDKSGEIELDNGERIPMARRRRLEVLEALKHDLNKG